MKKRILPIVLLTASFSGFAQDTDSFEKFDVGPFEVVDKDHNYRLRDGVDIAEYLPLKRPMKKNNFQADIVFSLPKVGPVSTYGIDFVWKRNISESWFLNIGIAAAIPGTKAGVLVFKRDNDKPEIREGTASSVTSCYFGVPITIEYMWGRNSIVSGYLGFGLTPGEYFINSDILYEDGKEGRLKHSTHGFFLAPRVDAGIYVPIGKHYLRAGVLLEYKIDFANSDIRNIFKYGIGYFMPGISLGLAF